MDNKNFPITETWLEALTGPEFKKHEAAALAIVKTPTFDPEIIAALKQAAQNDTQKYARDAAKKALQKIAETHFEAGNEIRAYLEQLRAMEADKTRAHSVETTNQPQAGTAEKWQAGQLVAAPKQAEPKTAAPHTTTAAPVPAAAVEPRAEPKPIAPPKPQVPFDQWLLSERNIKLALYSGGFLLLLAGLIFVGVNWTYLPGVAKLGVTLAVTLALYAGGAFLFKRPSLKIGGTALLAIASGFLPLNFLVTHLYLTSDAGISAELMWFIASCACGAAYVATALWTRNNLFTVFALIALLSGMFALTALWRLDASAMMLGYALVVLGVLLASFAVSFLERTRFMARTLRVAAQLSMPLVFLGALGAWILALVLNVDVRAWMGTVSLLLVFAFYVFDAWRAHSLYARWCAAIVLGVCAVLTCMNLQLPAIQTGVALKLVAAGYLLVGYRLQRGQALRMGMPLYAVSALLALFVSFQSFLVYAQTPEHFALALAGDVALLGLATYLLRRVRFLYAAVWLAIVPVYIFAQTYVQDFLWRGLVMCALLLLDSVIGFVLVKKHQLYALPFLTAAAFLSVGAPVLLYPNFAVLTVVLSLIALGYAVMALRMRESVLLYALFAFADVALVCAVKIFMPWDWNLARVVAFVFGAVAVVLYYADRELQYLRVQKWNEPFAHAAVANLGLTFLLVAAIAINDVSTAGAFSIQLVSALSWGVALCALTVFLYRRAEFLYAATWLAIAPAYIFAKLYLPDATAIGLAMGAWMLLYAAAGYFVGRARLVWSGAFLSAAAALSVGVPLLLALNSTVMTMVLVVIAFGYTFFAVWLRWRWLTLAAMVALNAALLPGIWSVPFARANSGRALVIGFAALGMAFIAGGVELKRRGMFKWRVPLYLVGALDLSFAFVGSLATDNLYAALISFALALIALAMQWVERAGLSKWKTPTILTYCALLLGLNGFYFASYLFNAWHEMVPVVLAAAGALYVGAALLRWRGDLGVLYATPMRYVGLGAVGITLLATIYFNVPLYAMLTFAIGALAYGADGWRRKQVVLLYAGGAMTVVAWSYLMRIFNIEEMQAFAMPLGIYALAVGWSEMRAGRMMMFQTATIAGLLVLFGSAFYQSLANVNYAMLLLVESALAFAYGAKMHSRIFVEAAILGLLANGIAQFGPAFIQLERWVQIGTIGSVLLLGGLVALFRRQKLLDARRALTSEWKMWKP